ncbi:MAG: DMT family transporter [Alphaproteobacteria bacterium]|nr:DMT family transporter [Alphaproteobacteria bacterium]
MSQVWKAAGLLALAVLAAGSAWPVMKHGLADATPVWFAAGRAALSAVAAFVLLAALGRLRRPARADLPIILSIGGLQLCAFFTLTHLGLKLLPAGRSVVLAYTTTLWIVPLAGPLIGEWPRRRQLMGVLLGLCGVAVLLAPAAGSSSGRDARSAEALLGHVYLIGAALAWALAILHSRFHRWHLTPLQVMPWQMLFAFVLLLPLAFTIEPAGFIAPTARALLPLAYVGLFAGPVITWAATSAASLIPAVASSLGFLATPVVGVAISALWLGEPIGLDLVTGGALVLAGASVATVAGRTARR